ncbi:hypothetical protein MCUN1_002874 [Malassezia cuniculi]|uniref:U3 small nucleolar RNA-associated protein 11 n=1 Tax=Malassezia cuniculi TaxID=948313 RepID=A0AAF0ES67_9BASI|nr:hypothetical protein MCUN1_002874 [Malassezia cuniculi]
MALRNYIQRRNHKERSQPANRKRFGLLEKHKDYVERARDHHVKRDKLKRMRQKAADRNPDEFYHGMLSTRTQRGVHVASRGNEALSNDVVALLKTQDAGYLRKQLATERKRLDALVAQIAPRVPGMRLAWLQKKPARIDALRRADLLGSVGNGAAGGADSRRVAGFGKKTLWVDDDAELAAAKPSKKRKNAAEQLTAEEKTGERQLGILLRELATRQKRVDALGEAARKLDTVRSLMSTRGSHAAPRHVAKLQDAVVSQGARITSRGLVVAKDDDDDSRGERTTKMYKWSNVRKK